MAGFRWWRPSVIHVTRWRSSLYMKAVIAFTWWAIKINRSIINHSIMRSYNYTITRSCYITIMRLFTYSIIILIFDPSNDPQSFGLLSIDHSILWFFDSLIILIGRSCSHSIILLFNHLISLSFDIRRIWQADYIVTDYSIWENDYISD
jgi:hypothetical protein